MLTAPKVNIILYICVDWLTWWSDSKLLIKGNTQGTQYFTCWGDYKKPQLSPGIELYPQRWESITLTTAPISLTFKWHDTYWFKFIQHKHSLLTLCMQICATQASERHQCNKYLHLRWSLYDNFFHWTFWNFWEQFLSSTNFIMLCGFRSDVCSAYKHIFIIAYL